MNTENLQYTPLYDLHKELQAKLVPFAGYAMPVQYPAGIRHEHQHTRSKAGLFDVSHMGQVLISGVNATSAIEKLMPLDLETLAVNRQCYGLLMNESGGIIDDLIIGRLSENAFSLVINAACKDSDFSYLQRHLPSCEVRMLADKALLALQGPLAKVVMEKLAPESTKLGFMGFGNFQITGIDCQISRCGYTGEDGFEISMASENAEELARAILAFEAVEPVGLGARDTLRLEAGLCLYGHDINTETTPIEAGLSWSISPGRRFKGDKEGGYPGACTVLEQQKDGVGWKRVGLIVEGPRQIREGTELLDLANNSIGQVTSGGFSPTLEKPIAMAYINTPWAQPGIKLQAKVRDTLVNLTVTKLPFVAHCYYRG